ncbi:glycosyltransferase [Caldivirga maquilingensis]|uniref:Glycosyl transferase group 1 n=1 Tax=Caldivirga maquilingensis (strain ATCC 700844 / DSM 13496 / JCM 10307 / IC-167) TaxID=397948 RepID=A8MCT6_CALMQ|nr:glycosyltransferase [Caldivirga maquilingensis]ABW01592.1 glycosyl transferase group 1 [Caldivirga maquilingensis IC-167]
MTKVSVLVPVNAGGFVKRLGPMLRLFSLPYGDFEIEVTGDVSSIIESRSMSLDALSGLRLAVKVLHDNLRKLDSVVHAFFWYIRPSGRLILETDQSPGQFFTGYLNMAPVKTPVRALYKDSVLITWSRWARDGLLRDGFSDEQVKVVPLPYVESLFRVKATKIKAVAFVGYDYYRKGGDLALKTMAVIKSIDPSVKTIYIGQIPHGVPRFIDEYHAYLPRSRILKTFAESMIALAPSRHEAYGLAAMDAIANKAIVVATDVEGLGEFVKVNGGVVCPLGDLNCLIENTLRYLDRREHEARANLQLQRLIENHNLGRIRNMMKEIYEEASSK